jgi:hypothetical protein
MYKLVWTLTLKKKKKKKKNGPLPHNLLDCENTFQTP